MPVMNDKEHINKLQIEIIRLNEELQEYKHAAEFYEERYVDEIKKRRAAKKEQKDEQYE